MIRYLDRVSVESKAEHVCKEFGILGVFRNVLAKNKSNWIPYHNWYHTCSVMVNCYDGAAYHDLSFDTARDLLIAALFHDFDHSAGKMDDIGNINQALLGLTELCDGLYNVNKIGKFIQCTEYPFIHEPICIEQRILRDADLMQCIMPDAENMILHHLRREVEERNGPIDFHFWVRAQIDFLSNVKFYTKWGEDIYERLIYCDLTKVQFMSELKRIDAIKMQRTFMFKLNELLKETK